jgi:hypothetical protein
MGFMVDKLAVEQVFIRVLRLSSAIPIPPMFVLVFVYMLLFPEGQTVEAWEPFGTGEHWIEKYFHFKGLRTCPCVVTRRQVMNPPTDI